MTNAKMRCNLTETELVVLQQHYTGEIVKVQAAVTEGGALLTDADIDEIVADRARRDYFSERQEILLAKEGKA